MGENSNDRIDRYVKSYLYEDKGSLKSYIDSHSDVLKVKASVFHAEPDVIMAMLSEIAKCDKSELKKLKNGRHLIQVAGRYRDFKKEEGECPVSCFLRLSRKPSNDICENILSLYKVLAFFEFLDKDKHQSQVKDLLDRQEAALRQMLEVSPAKWSKKASKLKSDVQKFKLRKIKIY